MGGKKSFPPERSWNGWPMYVKTYVEGGVLMERPTLICSRMAAPGMKNIVHLVSMEGRYANGKFDFSKGVEKGKVLFPSLHRWEFHCPDIHNFKVNGRAKQKLKDAKIYDVKFEKISETALFHGEARFEAGLSEAGFKLTDKKMAEKKSSLPVIMSGRPLKD